MAEEKAGPTRQTNEVAGSPDMSATSSLRLIAGFGPVFGAFLYYLGRQYTEAYYEVIGVPPTALSFGVADYMYMGIRSWNFLLAFAFTFLIVVLWRLQRKGSPPPLLQEGPFWARLWAEIRTTLSWRKGAPQLMGIWMFFYWVYVVLLAFALASFFVPWNYGVKAFFGLGIVFGATILAWALMTDRPTMEFLRTSLFRRRAFMLAVLVTLVMLPQSVPTSLGAFVALRDLSRAEQRFPKVQLTVREPPGPADLNWQRAGEDHFTNAEPLLLVFSTDTQLFLRRVGGSPHIFSVPTAEVVGVQSQSPGWW